mmetsp:Transcript_20757/g.59177  ORF Transcript_20757/g.59177 Transcript_20757/m.59177 type:complete len:285 (+) Transcript_20757:1179-2033(+)
MRKPWSHHRPLVGSTSRHRTWWGAPSCSNGNAIRAQRNTSTTPSQEVVDQRLCTVMSASIILNIAVLYHIATLRRRRRRRQQQQLQAQQTSLPAAGESSPGNAAGGNGSTTSTVGAVATTASASSNINTNAASAPAVAAATVATRPLPTRPQKPQSQGQGQGQAQSRPQRSTVPASAFQRARLLYEKALACAEGTNSRRYFAESLILQILSNHNLGLMLLQGGDDEFSTALFRFNRLRMLVLSSGPTLHEYLGPECEALIQSTTRSVFAGIILAAASACGAAAA